MFRKIINAERSKVNFGLKLRKDIFLRHAKVLNGSNRSLKEIRKLLHRYDKLPSVLKEDRQVARRMLEVSLNAESGYLEGYRYLPQILQLDQEFLKKTFTHDSYTDQPICPGWLDGNMLKLLQDLPEHCKTIDVCINAAKTIHPKMASHILLSASPESQKDYSFNKTLIIRTASIINHEKQINPLSPLFVKMIELKALPVQELQELALEAIAIIKQKEENSAAFLPFYIALSTDLRLQDDPEIKEAIKEKISLNFLYPYLPEKDKLNVENYRTAMTLDYENFSHKFIYFTKYDGKVYMLTRPESASRIYKSAPSKIQLNEENTLLYIDKAADIFSADDLMNSMPNKHFSNPKIIKQAVAEAHVVYWPFLDKLSQNKAILEELDLDTWAKIIRKYHWDHLHPEFRTKNLLYILEHVLDDKIKNNPQIVQEIVNRISFVHHSLENILSFYKNFNSEIQNNLIGLFVEKLHFKIEKKVIDSPVVFGSEDREDSVPDGHGTSRIERWTDVVVVKPEEYHYEYSYEYKIPFIIQLLKIMPSTRKRTAYLTELQNKNPDLYSQIIEAEPGFAVNKLPTGQ